MNLRRQMLLAQAPLVAALALLTVLSAAALGALGRHAEQLLADNFRSVLAMQRAKDALARIDAGMLLLLAGEAGATAQIDEASGRFEAEVRVQEGNLTEPGEDRLTTELRRRWNDCEAAVRRLLAAPSRAAYEADAGPACRALREQTDRILALNQDAMLQRSTRARASALRTAGLLVAGAAVAALIGLVCSAALTRKVVRPIAVLQQTARRIGGGDLAARARVGGADEIAELASEIDAMAERLERYRESSLGELLQAQAAAQAAIESLPDPVVIFGAAGDVFDVNRVAEAWLAVRLEREGLAKVEPAVRSVLEKVRTHVLSGRGAYQPRGFAEAVRVGTPEGERWLLPHAAPVYGEGGEVAGAAVVMQDVSRLRRFDEIESGLVTTVAEAFREPLLSLRMSIHVCLEELAGPITPKQAELLHAAREACERLQTVVDDLFDLARIQAGRLQLRRAPVRAAELVDAAVDESRDEAQERGVEVQASVEPGTCVHADRERIALVISQLLARAIRRSKSGGAVRVEATADGDCVRFSVADEGPAIPPEELGGIFETFDRRPESTPIGLSIARDIVEAHAGSVGVDAGPEQGGRIWFRLPAEG